MAKLEIQNNVAYSSTGYVVYVSSLVSQTVESFDVPLIYCYTHRSFICYLLCCGPAHAPDLSGQRNWRTNILCHTSRPLRDEYSVSLDCWTELTLVIYWTVGANSPQFPDVAVTFRVDVFCLISKMADWKCVRCQLPVESEPPTGGSLCQQRGKVDC